MTNKIFKTVLAVAMIVALLVSLLIICVLYSFFDGQMREELQNEATLLSAVIDASGEDVALLRNAALAEGMRITWIDSDGTVLFDTNADETAMENHADREEFQEAIESGTGESERYSDTISEKTIYYAIRQEDGTVLRLSNTVQSIWGIVLGMAQSFVIIIIGVGIVSFILAKRLSKWIVRPINTIDLAHPEDSDVYDELTPLLSRLSRQNRRIDEQIEMLKRDEEELATILDNMSEGLVMISSAGHVLTINASAMQLFGVGRECIGKSFIAVSRDPMVGEVVSRAQAGKTSVEIWEKGVKAYQLYANPVELEDGSRGVVLLILDVTEKTEAERLRREFSANVSHELKTPLTSIVGYAEIMKNGMVDPKTVPEFAGRIYDESGRLIKLIEDIINLSILDEGDINAQKESISLHEMAEEIAEQLEPSAKEKNISFSVYGDGSRISGVRRIIYEIVYNLMENAVKYNVENGKVRVTVESDDETVSLTVADTGIGIPAEQQDKVFERFYRVDKSHSKETGGTGLGLSIVKHGALFHHAKVSMKSKLGEGTEITVVFPKEEE